MGDAAPAAVGPWCRTRSPEEAIHVCAASFYPHRLALLGPSHSFGMSQRVTRVGPITIGDVTYDTDVTPILAMARYELGGAIDPIATYRASGWRARKAQTRKPPAAASAGIV